MSLSGTLSEKLQATATGFDAVEMFEAMPERYMMLKLGAPQIPVCSNVQDIALDDPPRAAANLGGPSVHSSAA